MPIQVFLSCRVSQIHINIPTGVLFLWYKSGKPKALSSCWCCCNVSTLTFSNNFVETVCVMEKYDLLAADVHLVCDSSHTKHVMLTARDSSLAAIKHTKCLWVPSHVYSVYVFLLFVLSYYLLFSSTSNWCWQWSHEGSVNNIWIRAEQKERENTVRRGKEKQ